MLESSDILYCDNHLLAVNKPAGLLTQPSGTDRESLEEQAKAWVKEEYNKPGAVFLEAVHRIDKEVSGVVLFARTSKALSRMNEQIRAKQVKKIYHALVEAVPKESQATLTDYVKHGSHRAVVTGEIDPESKEAVLHYKMLRTIGNFTLLEIILETGRYHQIRAQLSAIGCPIAGDGKYGAQTLFEENAIALHHHHLEVLHPTLKSELSFVAPYPFFWPADLGNHRG